MTSTSRLTLTLLKIMSNHGRRKSKPLRSCQNGWYRKRSTLLKTKLTICNKTFEFLVISDKITGIKMINKQERRKSYKTLRKKNSKRKDQVIEKSDKKTTSKQSTD